MLLRLGEEETASESQVVQGFLSSFLQLIFTETAQNGIKALCIQSLECFQAERDGHPSGQVQSAGCQAQILLPVMYPPALPVTMGWGEAGCTISLPV